MSTAVAPTEDPYRLPTNVKATHYDITIKTDLEALTFQGLVKVTLDVKDNTSKITLNTSGIELGKASIYSDASKSAQPAIFASFDEKQHRTVYQLADTLPAESKAELIIVFSGKLTESSEGYFWSSWEKDGKTQNYVLTHFEPTYARRAFPCWDEPLLKATFSITMISRLDTVNLSNMPAITEEVLDPGGNISSELADIVPTTQHEKWKITKFETTPPMSTYIVAFANGHFEFLETSVVMHLSGKVVPLRIYATSDVIDQAQFALDVKAAILPLCEKVFNIEYPLPKLDTLIAARDFYTGAMANWGLITGHSDNLLLDPSRVDELEEDKRFVAKVQSHQVAHMWFGNTTTVEWWNHLYLNHGVASVIGNFIMDKMFPLGRHTSEFILVILNKALALDSTLSSDPIEVECPDATDISEIYGLLLHHKTASVFRMLSKYVGEERFLHGATLYLKKRPFGNGVAHDLWEDISTATGVNISLLIENWITKVGYPVLTVTENENSIHVRQDRFLVTGPADPEDNETIWNIPLSLLSTRDGKSSVDATAILLERHITIALDTSKPYKLNAGTTGLFRVLYTPERLSKIAAEAAKEDSVFSLDDRMGLVYDAFALAQAGLAKLSSVLTLVDLWKHEKENLVWQAIGCYIENILSIWWEHPEIVEKLNVFCCDLFVPLIEKLGYEHAEKESLDTTSLRILAIEQAAISGAEGVIKELQSRFKYYIETGDESKIPAEIRGTIFYAAVKYGGRAEYDAVVKIYDNPRTLEEKKAAVCGLASSQDPALLEEMIRYMSTKAQDPDIVYLSFHLGSNIKARRLLTKYLQEEYDTLYERLQANFKLLGDLVKNCTQYYSSEKDYEAVKAFFEDKDTSEYDESLEQALDTILQRSAYIDHSTADLADWLGRRY